LGRGSTRALGSARIGEILGAWRPVELRIARGFPECRGLAGEQLEDLYQETALALLTQPYASEGHLRNALRHGIKHRALNLHRDERRHARILAQSAPSLERAAESHGSQAGPEDAALRDEDRLIVGEFLTELDAVEQRVFWLIAEGMRYRAIAAALAIPVNEARNACRSCERKRERFQLLYDTGRLCGYRAATIRTLQNGQLTSEELARRAFAHLEHCARCRAEHNTNAHRLRRTFHGQAQALLPLPALLRLGWLRHPWLRARPHAQRALARCASAAQGGGGVRERATAVLGAGGVGAKLTAGAITVAVVAGGAIGATHALEHHTGRAHHHTAAPPETTRTMDLNREPLAPQGTWPDGKSGRSRSSVHVAASRGQTASARSGAGPDAAEHEFGLSPPPSAPTNTQQTATHGAADSPDAAEREFGLSPPPSAPASTQQTATPAAADSPDAAEREFGSP
jgi:RNA polymerase sigma factor (sigma-70 family)